LLKSIDERLSAGEWLVGNKITIIDFWVAGIVYTNILGNPHSDYPKDRREEVLDLFPNFKKYGERYRSTIKTYLESREPLKI
jgi:glutathione S-transferase